MSRSATVGLAAPPLGTPAGEARSRVIRAYYHQYPMTDPAYNVVRISGRNIRDRARRHFRGRLLEIGCGTKAKAALVGDFVDEHVGLDHQDCPHDQSAIDLFGSANEIPADDDAFDCVLSTAVLEHLEDPLTALREAYRVLKPGGSALYTAPLFWHVHEAPRDFFRYTAFGLRYLFEKAGFEIVEITPLSGFWVTAAAELGYYLHRFRHGIMRPPVGALVVLLNWLAPKLDRGPFRDESFTWMYLIVARRPAAERP